MRFGKTSAAMQVAKENEMQKVLIVTHRPSVSADWYDDFNKVLAGANYEYSSKAKGYDIKTLIKGDKSFGTFDGCVSASKVIFREMESRGSTVCNWGSANKEYLARMLEGPCKVFVQRTNIDSMSFTTDALH